MKQNSENTVERVLAFNNCFSTCPLGGGFVCVRSAKKIITSVYDSNSKAYDGDNDCSDDDDETGGKYVKGKRKSRKSRKTKMSSSATITVVCRLAVSDIGFPPAPTAPVGVSFF